MATTRMRRAGAAKPDLPVDADGDRLYTEEDYASSEVLPDEWAADAPYAAAGWTEEEPLPDEAFEPDEENVPPYAGWSDAADAGYDDNYEPLFDEDSNFSDDPDPLDDELLTEEEQAELRRSNWQLLAGLADFAGIVLGTAMILLLVALLVSLLNWLINDLSQSFILLQKNF